MDLPNHLMKEAKAVLGVRATEIIAHGIGVQKWDSRNLKGLCPYHNEKTPSFTWNKKENYFKCFGCGKTMDIIDYYQESGMDFIDAAKELFKETGISHDFERSNLPVLNKDKRPYVYPAEEQNADTAQIEKYLSLRKISKRTIDYAGVKQDKDGNIAFEFKNQDGVLMLVKYRPARKLKDGENKTWCQKDKDTAPILYGMNKIDPSKPLLICEGEIDRLSAIEAGFYNAVSVPFGAGNYSWIEYNWNWLEQFEKIIIWSDADAAGEKMRKEVIPRLGEYRCYYVKSQHKDINIHLYRDGKESVLKAIDDAKEVPIPDVIDMADVDDYDITNAEKIKSGINGLDKWIGGFVLGTVGIITGINGAGKSTFVNQACVVEPVSQGYKTFIFSGELTKPQLRSWIEYPLAGREHVTEKDNGPNQPKTHYIPKTVKEQMRDWYRGKIFIYDNDDDTRASTILRKMEELARRYGVKNFVLDNLMMIDLECNEYEKLTKQKDFVKNLISFARKFLCVVHLVAHPRKTETIQRLTKLDVAGSGDITNLAHYVTAIHRVTPKEKEDKYDKKGKLVAFGCKFDCIVDLFKNRPLGHQDKSIGVYYEHKSKRFYGDSDDPNKQYDWTHKQIGIAGFYEVEEEAMPWDEV
ncbi:CHC2 zinc finger domain-containing protein [Anaerosolibacter sp.]|uniref:CHC2 zinc finger domain-containing protein n=1 Tax=Anaerosolibacter sp. TaxID=1872527 RepID=UPI0039F10C50